MGRTIAVFAAAALLGCVAVNDEFEGPGFHDPVDGYDALRWPEVDRGWEVNDCSIGGGPGTGQHWRAGTPNMCALPLVPATRAELASAEIPVFGHDVTLRFATRIALPSCAGTNGDTLALARVSLEVAGETDRILPATLSSDGGDELVMMSMGPDAAATLGGRSPGETWVGVTARFDVPQDADRVRLLFTYGWQGQRCDADPPEPSIAACCEDLRVNGASYTGWQIDDVSLELDASG